MAVFTSIGAALFGAGTFLAGVTAAGLQIAAGVAVSLIGRAIAGEPEAGRQRFGVQGRIQGGDAVPRSVIFGYASTSGSYVWGNTWGTANGVPNAYISQVIALADYPIRSLTGVIANDIPGTLGTSPHPQYGRPVLEYRKNGVDHMWVKFYDGTQTAADTFLTGTVASADRPWGTNRIGRGIPYVIVTCMAPERRDGEEQPLFQNGLPRFQFVVEGSRLYDPSRDTSVGGSGTQRYNQPATWGGDGDFLPVVQVYNIMRGIRYDGSWLYGLQSLPVTRLPVAAWINEINKCRTPIMGPNGMEPTYRTGGEVQVGAQIRLAIEAMLTGCQGRLTETGGTYKPFVGEPNAPVMSFSDADILSTEEQTFTPFYGLEDTINGIQATYPNPNEGWNDKTAPPLIRTDLEALDGNRRLMANVSLDMVPYGGQVQRLMKSALREAQRARRHTITMGPEFWVLEPGDYIVWNSARNGYVDKLFRVDGIADQPDLNVLLDITEVDPSDYDWNQAEDFRPVVDGPLQLVDTPPLPTIGWQVYGVAVLDEQGRERRPGIEVWYQSGLQNVRDVRVQVRVPGAASPFIDILIPYGSPWRMQIPGNFPPNTEYEVRGIFVLEGSGRGQWSAWLSVITPDVRLIGGLDFDPYGEVDLDALNDDLEGYLNWIGENTREILRQAQELATKTSDEVLANYSDHQRLRTELTSVYDLSRAQWSNQIDVATGPGSAIVSRIEQLEVEVQDGLATAVDLLQTQISTVEGQVTAVANSVLALNSTVGSVTASGLFRVETVASHSGATSTIGLSAAATAAGVTNTSSLFISATSAGVSRVAIVADQFVVSSGPGGENAKQPLIFQDGTLIVNELLVATSSMRDLAVTNAKIANLAVDNAKIANLAVDNAKIANLAVDTIKIAAGAVSTVYSSVPLPNSIPFPGTSESPDLVSVTVVINEGEVLLQTGLDTDLRPTSAGDAFCDFAVTRNGTRISPIKRISGVNSVNFIIADSPGTGTFTYVLRRWTSFGYAAASTLSARYLVATNNKR